MNDERIVPVMPVMTLQQKNDRRKLNAQDVDVIEDDDVVHDDSCSSNVKKYKKKSKDRDRRRFCKYQEPNKNHNDTNSSMNVVVLEKRSPDSSTYSFASKSNPEPKRRTTIEDSLILVSDDADDADDDDDNDSTVCTTSSSCYYNTPNEMNRNNDNKHNHVIIIEDLNNDHDDDDHDVDDEDDPVLRSRRKNDPLWSMKSKTKKAMKQNNSRKNRRVSQKTLLSPSNGKITVHTKYHEDNVLLPSSSSSHPSSTSSSLLVQHPKQKEQHQSSVGTSWWQKSAVRKTVAFLEQDINQVLSESPFLSNNTKRIQKGTTATTTHVDSPNFIGQDTDVRNEMDYKDDSRSYPLADESSDEVIPLFQRSEIVIGQLLGRGGFADVYEIIDIHLDEYVSKRVSERIQQLRIQTASRVLDPITGRGRYVIKQLQERLLHKKHINKQNNAQREFELAASDLAAEVLYLSKLNHPNILAIRGKPFRGIYAFLDGRYDSYFMICDRLSDTLEDRIHKKWNTRTSMTTNTTNATTTPTSSSSDEYDCGFNGSDDVATVLKPDLVRKTWYASQLAEAIQYLHERRIIFRDLKPTNIGFAVNDPDHVVLFDFGLCRELPLLPPPSSRSNNASSTTKITTFMPATTKNKMTSRGGDDDDDDGCAIVTVDDDEIMYGMSNVGTRRYMAPEIVNDSRYNLKADVYSWAMVFYEILTHKKPFSSHSIEDHRITVCQGGERPRLSQTTIPSCIRILLKRSWNDSVRKRIPIKVVCTTLQFILNERDQKMKHLHIESPAIRRMNNGMVVPLVRLLQQEKQQDPPVQSLFMMTRMSQRQMYGIPALDDDTPQSPRNVVTYDPNPALVVRSSNEITAGVIQESSSLMCFSDILEAVNSSSSSFSLLVPSKSTFDFFTNDNYSNKIYDRNCRAGEVTSTNNGSIINGTTNGHCDSPSQSAVEVLSEHSIGSAWQKESNNDDTNKCGGGYRYGGCFPDIIIDFDYGVEVVTSLKSMWTH